MLRRRRFRTTAGPTGIPTAKATLGGKLSPVVTQRTQRGPTRAFLFDADKRANDSRSWMAQIRPTAEACPWRAGPSGWHAQRVSPSDDGTRASWIACDYLVEKFVSPVPPRLRCCSATTSPYGTARSHIQCDHHGYAERASPRKRRKARPRASQTTTAVQTRRPTRYPQGSCYGSAFVMKASGCRRIPQVIHRLWTQVWMGR